MDDARLEVRLVKSLDEIDASDWNAVANPGSESYDPFLSWQFLQAMEESGVASPETGWAPHHIIVEKAGQGLCGAMPLYLKSHSQGEFVFDHSWADAYERAGGHYYPKLLSAVPFTPVTGRRRLVRPGPDATQISDALLGAAVKIAADNDISSLHINFLTGEDALRLEAAGLLVRTDQQFHWHNDGYESFDDFLAVLSSAKRKNLRKERHKAQEGLTFSHITGNEITEDHWDVFYEFYMDTGARKWGTPYLNRASFSLLGERLADDILLIFAEEDGHPIAGALNMIGGDRLLGRYWGTVSPRPMLHFETCYYQAIDFAISRGLKTVEAGAQGGHKLARGYVPETTYSAHWIAHEGLAGAVEEYLDRERQMVERESNFLRERTPFKKDG
ncbi:GNAT family N-acetyltransferase [Henriciella marina]|uniref:GNAT family N-acetyltransferase n=1 Tax=Henriciella marina TaxID=453851 RepID=UPI00036F7F49|nr:GNAT family N-acetyltransferase [Henriciella marina]